MKHRPAILVLELRATGSPVTEYYIEGPNSRDPSS